MVGEGKDGPRGQCAGHGLFLGPLELLPEGPDDKENSQDTVSTPWVLDSLSWAASEENLHNRFMISVLLSAQVRCFWLTDLPKAMWGLASRLLGFRVHVPDNRPGPPSNLRRGS